MFNIGGDDKEKLKENMEEIRNLVNSETEEVSEPQQNDDSENQPPNRTQPSQAQTSMPDSSESTDNRSLDQLASGEEQQQEFEEAQSQQQNTPPSEPRDNREGLSSRQDMKNHLESISNEVKKMDEGERSSGDTLFLEVDEFNEVQTMVEEMKYLSREMKDLMNNLDEGIEEDRRVEGEAENVLDDFSERREKIQSALQ